MSVITVAVAEQLIRQTDPTTLQRVLIDALDAGVTAFVVKPDGMTWTEFEARFARLDGR